MKRIRKPKHRTWATDFECSHCHRHYKQGSSLAAHVMFGCDGHPNAVKRRPFTSSAPTPDRGAGKGATL